MSGVLFTLPNFVPLNDGAPVPGGKLTFSRTGTTTLQDTFSDSALTVANTNPVVADADGVFSMIYLDNTTGYDYRVKFTDANDVLIWQEDDIKAGNTAAPVFRVVGTAPYFILQETDATANNGRWRTQANGESLKISLLNDSENSATDAIQIDRTGTTLDSVSIFGTQVLMLSSWLTAQKLSVGASGTGITYLLTGAATFSAGTTVAVSFGITLAASTYKVLLTPRADPVGRLWAASPTTTGFTLTNSSSTSISVDWVVML